MFILLLRSLIVNKYFVTNADLQFVWCRDCTVVETAEHLRPWLNVIFQFATFWPLQRQFCDYVMVVSLKAGKNT